MEIERAAVFFREPGQDDVRQDDAVLIVPAGHLIVEQELNRISGGMVFEALGQRNASPVLDEADDEGSAALGPGQKLPIAQAGIAFRIMLIGNRLFIFKGKAAIADGLK